MILGEFDNKRCGAKICKSTELDSEGVEQD